MDRVQNIKGLPDHNENFSLYSISETVPMMSLGTLEVYTNPLAITIGYGRMGGVEECQTIFRRGKVQPTETFALLQIGGKENGR